MANKIFIDTNVVLDFLLCREGELEEIVDIINLSKRKKLSCYISESVIATSIYFLQKEKRQTLNMLREFCSAVNVLPYAENILFADIDIFTDIEDGFLYFIAVHHKMNYFITRNSNDFKKAPAILPVFTPKAFLKHIYSDDIP
jgi:predicted nucleic acid-binding protein